MRLSEQAVAGVSWQQRSLPQVSAGRRCCREWTELQSKDRTASVRRRSVLAFRSFTGLRASISARFSSCSRFVRRQLRQARTPTRLRRLRHRQRTRRLRPRQKRSHGWLLRNRLQSLRGKSWFVMTPTFQRLSLPRSTARSSAGRTRRRHRLGYCRRARRSLFIVTRSCFGVIGT